MLNKQYLQYTFLHRQALIFVIEKCIKDEVTKARLLERAKWHDLDKAFLYTKISKKMASAYHRTHSAHHDDKVNTMPKTHDDLLEAVMDYECAGYTKADKPLNAYDTLMTYDFNHKDEMLSILHDLGIDHSYQNTPNDAEWQEFQKSMPEITDEHIMSRIHEWVFRFPNTAKEYMDYADSILKGEITL